MMVKGLSTSSNSQKPKIRKPHVKKPPTKLPPTSKSTPSTSPQPVIEVPPGNRKDVIERQILDLRLKLTEISKKIIDLDMENIMGSISNEEFEDKQKKLIELEGSVKSKIAE